MSVCNDVADCCWLTGSEAAALLTQLAAGDAPLHTAVERLRSRLTPGQTHLLLEQIELRRRARAKFSAADRMFFTRVGLEQATDEDIAWYKASRFARFQGGSSSPPIFADLCCGIGGDMLALAAHGALVAVDRDPTVAHFARANASAGLDATAAAPLAVKVADVEQWDLDGVAAWHIDPDRRIGGRRTTSLANCRPALPTMEHLLAEVPHAAMKLAPATDVPEAWSARCELEWISRGGECRQQVAWHGDLADAPGRRRATLVDGERGVALRSIVGEPSATVPTTDRLDRYVFDVDPAVLAAQLDGALAAEHGLCALSAGATYLTGPAPVIDPLPACFEVEEVLPMGVRKLARHLRARRIGELEIKKRGVDVSPEALRAELKLRGENAATLLVTRVAGRPVAILAHRVSP